MQNKFNNSFFARLYLWMTKAKLTMGIFFVVFVVFYLFFGWIIVRQSITLDFFTAVEMLFACFFIGLAQQTISPINNLTIKSCVLWIVTGGGITLIFSLVFNWFALFPSWFLIIFVGAVMFGMGAMILSYYLELNHETRKLNNQLARFQKQDSV